MSEQDKINEEEIKLMVSLLRKYSETMLDQFEHWSFSTEFGTVFIDLSRKVFSDESNYINLDHLFE